MPRNAATTFSITNVSRIAEVSARRLAYWDSIGLVKPSVEHAHGKGSRRFYSFQDIAEAKIVGRLQDCGLSLQRIRRSFDFIRSLRIPICDLAIVSDGETIYVCNSEDVIVDTLKGGQILLTLVVADMLRELEAAASDREREPSESTQGCPIDTGEETGTDAGGRYPGETDRS